MDNQAILDNAPPDDSWKYHFYMTEAKTEVYADDFPLCTRAWVKYGRCLSLQDISDDIASCYEFHDIRSRDQIERIVELERQLKAYRCLDGDLIYITKTELAERESEKTHKAVKHGFLQAVKMLFLAKPPAPLGIDVHANNCADDYLKQLKAEVHHGQ
jgi:hypothetical protein